jgi:hypothetical protein
MQPFGLLRRVLRSGLGKSLRESRLIVDLLRGGQCLPLDVEDDLGTSYTPGLADLRTLRRHV